MTDVLASQVTVTSTATKLISKAPAGQQIQIKNRDASASCYCGPSTVTAVTGMEVKGGEELSKGPFELPPETELYAITASGSVRVDVFAVVGD